MRRICGLIWIFVAGGVAYNLMEILWRGYSHWTMTLCGGACLLFLYLLCRRGKHRNLFLLGLEGACAITAVEFLTGCTVNLWLGWQVWDYSQKPLSLFGQICLPYSFLWFCLSVVFCLLYRTFTLLLFARRRHPAPQVGNSL